MDIYTQYQADALQAFEFLCTQYSFVITRNEVKDTGVYIEYTKADRRVLLSFERMEERFYYYLIQPGKTELFINLFLKCEPGINWKDLEPTFDKYKVALAKNVELLKKYGSGFLSGVKEL